MEWNFGDSLIPQLQLTVGGIGLELDSLVNDVITFIILGKEEAPALPRQRQPWGREIPMGQGWQQESKIKRLNPQIRCGCSLRMAGQSTSCKVLNPQLSLHCN